MCLPRTTVSLTKLAGANRHARTPGTCEAISMQVT